MALTDTEARRARPTTKPYKLADSGGLFLAVMPAGGKLWRWKYRFEGREKLMALTVLSWLTVKLTIESAVT